MKNIILLIVLILFIVPSAYASPETVNVSGLDDENIYSSDTNEVQIEKNIENMVDYSVDLSEYSQYISASTILDDFSENDSRTCPFCYYSLVLVGVWVVLYGERNKKRRKFESHWFVPTLIFSAIVYIFHGFIHANLASTFFMNYYWMMMFDVLLLGYIYLSSILNYKQKIIISCDHGFKRDNYSLTFAFSRHKIGIRQKNEGIEA